MNKKFDYESANRDYQKTLTNNGMSYRDFQRFSRWLAEEIIIPNKGKDLENGGYKIQKINLYLEDEQP